MTTTITVWCLLIEHAKNCVGDAFEVDVSSDASVAKLKERVIEKSPDLKDIAARNLTVWRCKDTSVRNESARTLKQRIKSFVFSEKSVDVEDVDPEETVGELSLASKEKLLVQVPGASCEYVSPSEPNSQAHCFLDP